MGGIYIINIPPTVFANGIVIIFFLIPTYSVSPMNSTVIEEPDWSADICNTFHENDVLPLKDSVYISGKGAAKSLWYRLEDGSFIHSSGIQPVEHKLNAPNLEVGNSEKLVEVTVP